MSEGTRILGVDLGSRRVGVAICDDPEVPARPHRTLNVTESTLLDQLVAVVREAPTAEIVFGLPLQMDGSEGMAARRARVVAKRLERATGVRVVLVDERLTTVQAHRHRVAAGVRDTAKIDAHAAAILLQTHVDRRRHGWQPDDA